MLLGHWLEIRSLGQAEGALEALAALLPDEAERLGASGELETVPVSELLPGDVVLVRPGGRVPADGQIVEGEAEIDESMITGESAPVPKGPGDHVVAGTVSTDSSLRVRVEAVGEDTALAGIQRLIAAAQACILVKDRLALERMRNIDAVLFDKTGTLTKGRPALSGIAATGIAEEELLALAASAEAESEHPLARAIVGAARERDLAVTP